MKSIAIVVVFALCAAVVFARPAGAQNVTCGDLANLLVRSPSSCSDGNQNQTADAFESGVGIGSVLGIVDLIAGLICLGRSPQCTCARTLVSNNAEQFGARLGQRVTACVNRDPAQDAFVPILDALRDLCPF